MTKWLVTRSIIDEWEIDAETGPEAVKLAQERFGEAAGDTAPAEYHVATEDGQSPCEGCGKLATMADSEGVPLCRGCWEREMDEDLRREAEG